MGEILSGMLHFGVKERAIPSVSAVLRLPTITEPILPKMVELRIDPEAAKKKAARMRLPEAVLTYEQFKKIGRAEDFDKDFLKYCPMGTVFICSGSTGLEDAVIGVVVKGLEALADQWGAGLCIPDRFVNRYRPVVVGIVDFQI